MYSRCTVAIQFAWRSNKLHPSVHKQFNHGLSLSLSQQQSALCAPRNNQRSAHKCNECRRENAAALGRPFAYASPCVGAHLDVSHQSTERSARVQRLVCGGGEGEHTTATARDAHAATHRALLTRSVIWASIRRVCLSASDTRAEVVQCAAFGAICAC